MKTLVPIGWTRCNLNRGKEVSDWTASAATQNGHRNFYPNLNC